MKNLQALILISFAMILVTGSCVSRKKLAYLQYSGATDNFDINSGENYTSITPAAYKVMAYDNLFIRVVTPDPQWSAIFNIMPVGAGGAVTEESAGLFGYTVDVEGFIEIPFVGEVKVAGKTLNEIKVELDSVFRDYVADAAITVRLVNNYVSIIGEVSRPGRYLLTKERVNIFEALAMAGDMIDFSNRYRVQLIRPSPYGPVVKELSLADRSILSSEFYYIMPNDIIYTIPLKGKSFRINSSVWTLFLSTITSALGVIAFFRTL